MVSNTDFGLVSAPNTDLRRSPTCLVDWGWGHTPLPSSSTIDAPLRFGVSMPNAYVGSRGHRTSYTSNYYWPRFHLSKADILKY